MSKRSKRSSGGRDFGKQKKDMKIGPEVLLGLAGTESTFSLAAQKMAALDPSKTAQEWEECLVELLEKVVDLEDS